MSITAEESDLTIQQVSRRTGLAESALRYYKRIGLIDPVPRDDSSGHRRYPPDTVAAIESLSCLRGTGMSVQDMSAYVNNMRRGDAAATDAVVRRVVMRSSFAAIGYSPKPPGVPYNESDWTDPTADLSPYTRSKTLAERAAWDFVADPAVGLELTVINPVGVFGPVLGAGYASSIGLIRMLLDDKPPLLPRTSVAVVDVRDVADLHVHAMTSPAAAGQRFLAAAGKPLSFPQIAAILRAQLGDASARVPTREAPDWLVRAAARFVSALGTLADLLGAPKLISTAKATEILGWQARPAAGTIIATAESLLGLESVSE